MVDNDVQEFSTEAVQQCLGWLHGGRGVCAAVIGLVRAVLRFDGLRRRRVKDWLKDVESYDRKDSAVHVWVDGPALYSSRHIC